MSSEIQISLDITLYLCLSRSASAADVHSTSAKMDYSYNAMLVGMGTLVNHCGLDEDLGQKIAVIPCRFLSAEPCRNSTLSLFTLHKLSQQL